MKKMVKAFSNFVLKYLPDALSLAIILTIITYVMGLIFTDSTPFQMFNYWGEGLLSLYTFTMQQVMILLVGYAMALSDPIQKALYRAARVPKTTGTAVMFVAAVSMVLNYINWGLGMMAAAILAKEIAKSNSKIHFPILVAASFSGSLIRGFSASIPLAIATAGHTTEELVGVVPVTQTLFAPYNVILTICLFILTIVMYRAMVPKDDEVIPFKEISEAANLVEEVKDVDAKDTFSKKLDSSQILKYTIGFAGLGYATYKMFSGGTFNVDMNMVVLFFMFLGILLHKSLVAYKNAIIISVKTTANIMLNFPLYAGIMGMMKASGLSAVISAAFVSISTPETLPCITFLSAGFLNIFVPSGGGQWQIQGPIMLQAATELGANPAKVTMALAWGDAWTNQIQPFYALPTLAVAGLSLRDIMGYCMIFAIGVGVLFTVGFLVL